MELIELIVLLAAALLFLSVYLGRSYLKARRRRKIAAAPFPEAWEQILLSNVALYEIMPDDLKEHLRGLTAIFLKEKNFEGCGGQDVSDKVRVTIAGAASILLLNRKTDIYPTLQTILVYPDSYFASGNTAMGANCLHEETVRDGESWKRGEIIITWAQAERENSLANSSNNVVLHEFAHQLDFELGISTSIFSDLKDFADSANIPLSEEYENLRNEVERGEWDIIDDYGAENPAEFFAVATETFFGKPSHLKSIHPKLFDELKKIYMVDPSLWKSHENHITPR